MGTEYRATQADISLRYFNCGNCGARGEVAYRAEGDSGWHKEGLFNDDGADRARTAAEEDLMIDSDRVLGLIRCPTCGERHKSTVRWAYLRPTLLLVPGIALFAIFGTELWIGAAIFAALAGAQGWRERGRFQRANRALLLRLQPGKRPEALAEAKPISPMKPPVPKLPVAIAVNVPPLAAPEPVVQRGPDEEPAFLRKKD